VSIAACSSGTRGDDRGKTDSDLQPFKAINSFCDVESMPWKLRVRTAVVGESDSITLPRDNTIALNNVDSNALKQNQPKQHKATQDFHLDQALNRLYYVCMLLEASSCCSI
jgi:hypothetical protein